MKSQLCRRRQAVEANCAYELVILQPDQRPPEAMSRRRRVLKELDDLVAVRMARGRQNQRVARGVDCRPGVAAHLFTRPEEEHPLRVMQAKRVKQQALSAQPWRIDHSAKS